MAAQIAPKMLMNLPAQKAKSFLTASVNAATNLQAFSTFPNFAPQRTEFHAAVAGTITVTLEDGTDFLIDMAAGETVRIEIPIKAFKSAGATTGTARCYWWVHPGPGDWSYTPTINP